MRYRKLDTAGDYTFGHSSRDFLVDSPDAVAQAIKTRLLLLTGEWFLDNTEGTPYSTRILGTGTQFEYDFAIQERVLGTPNVLDIVEYSSSLSTARKLSVTMTVTTKFGTVNIATVL